MSSIVGELLPFASFVPCVIIGIIALVPLIWGIGNYNRFVRLRQHLRESWSDIDVELRRRYDLVPNLVNTVKGYAAHERETLERIIDARNRAKQTHDTVGARSAEESQLTAGVRQLFALAEGYPDLKADTHFLELQRELALTEDRIAAARRFYNANVREMNQLCATFPSNLIASVFGFTPAAFFELASPDERESPQVHV